MDTLTYRHYYLAPHLDDAVLSCGGLIHRQLKKGESVLVITVFAGTPRYTDLSAFASFLHSTWDLGPDPVALRRAEDIRALSTLGADHLHLQHQDCIYRHAPTGGDWFYSTRGAILGGIHPGDSHLMENLLQELRAILPPRNRATVCAPLVVGGHVDHRIVHRCALALLLDGHDVRFYEDYPYSLREGKRDEALRELPDCAWSSHLEHLSPEDLAAKIRAINEYGSQLGLLFGGRAEAEEATRAFAASLGAEDGYAERYWRLSQTRGD
jgi:LmbE family N-acetylglucosaminyl deacetylase